MWFKVDDQLHEHPKARRAGARALGVWVLAGSWCGRNLTDGFVPEAILTRWGTRKDAAALVDVGLWEVAEVDGERGWRFHDWSEFQPDARTVTLSREAKSEAGSRGNHYRWHRRRGVVDPECDWCRQDTEGTE